MALLKKYRKQFIAGVVLGVGVIALALLAWVFYLDRQITQQFEGRRWTLPAQVFAEPTELYVGQTFGADALERELKRLGYQRVAQPRQGGQLQSQRRPHRTHHAPFSVLGRSAGAAGAVDHDQR